MHDQRSPKLVDIYRHTSLVSDLLESDMRAIGRQWQVWQVEGQWLGRIVPDIIRSRSGHVQDDLPTSKKDSKIKIKATIKEGEGEIKENASLEQEP